MPATAMPIERLMSRRNGTRRESGERHRVERPGRAAAGEELPAPIDQEGLHRSGLSQEVQEDAVDPLRVLLVDGQIVI